MPRTITLFQYQERYYRKLVETFGFKNINDLNIVLIYPQNFDMKDPIRKSYRLKRKSSATVSARTINLSIQLLKDFEKLIKEVRKSLLTLAFMSSDPSQ